MKWMIASDLHGSAYYCKLLMQRWAEEQADTLIFLGDILYHGPRNDLPRDYAPKEVIAMLNPLADKLLCVRGNCDCEVDQMVLQFPIPHLPDARPRHQQRPSPALRRGGHPAPRPHARAGLRGLRHVPLSEPRLGVHPQKRLAPQLYDARERPVHLEGCHHRRTLAELEPLISDHRFRPSKGPLYQGGLSAATGMGRPSHGAPGSKRPPRRFSKAPGRLVSISITALHTPWRSSRRRARC